MRVALDATPLSLSTGGLTRYAGELSRALARAYPTDDFVLFSDRGFPLPEPCRENLRVGAQPRNAFEKLHDRIEFGVVRGDTCRNASMTSAEEISRSRIRWANSMAVV